MKHLTFAGSLAILFFAGAAGLTAAEPNTLTASEEKQGFALLFNGKDFTGWQNAGNWVVEDGAMFRKDGGGGLTYQTAKVPDDFELRFEWKVAPGSNSGVYYRPGQYEYQILDNQKHHDGQNPRTSAASIYFCMAPSHDNTHPVGEWNEGRIVCNGTVIQHWLNGEKVVDMDYADPEVSWNVEWLAARGGKLADRGANLSLQDHGDPVWYRSLRWRALGPGDKVEHTEVKPAEIPPAILEAERKKLEGIIARREEQKAKAKAK